MRAKWPSSADARGLLVVLLSFALLGLLLPIGAEPPIGDAWSYAWSARQLAEHSVLRLTDFQAMSLIGQLWLTRPFTWAFSAEPAVLNLVTFGFSAITACLFYGLLRVKGTPRSLAGLGVATLVANPIYLAQSMSFDTEIYFLFASLLGALAFVLWQRSARTGWLWLAGLAFALAVLIRQHALAFPIAAAAALWWSRRDAREARPGLAVVSLALAPLALIAFYAWLRIDHGVPKAYLWHQADLLARLANPAGFAAYAAIGSLESLHYLALFLAPLLAVLACARAPRRRRLAAYAAAAASVGAGTALLWREGQRMPYLPNLITLREVFLPHRLLADDAWLRSLVTGLSTLLAIVLLAELTARWPARPPREAPATPRSLPSVFLGTSAALLLVFSIATGIRFERYLLLPLPFLMAWLLVVSERRLGLVAGWLCLAPVLLFSLYFADQRVRFAECEWQAAHAALELDDARFRIDGGVAFNGYFSYERMSRAYGRDPTLPWHPAIHPAALVLVRPLPLPSHSYELLQRHSCSNHPGLQALEMLLYRRRH